jgi:hypothetical protein
MTFRNYVILFFISLLVFVIAASFQHSPGYMDADYYLLTGQQLAEGRGFTEPVLWNYLDNPNGLPHPSHAYWMPLASFIASFGLILLPSLDPFQGSRIFFILLAALIPPHTAKLTFALSKNRGAAFLAGGFAIIPVFYFPYLVTIDTFAISMVLGALFFSTVLAYQERSSGSKLVIVGLIAGLLHLARAEGFVWLATGLVSARILRAGWRGLFATVAGYLLVMGPWFIRNWLVFGSPLAAGPSRSMWMTAYDQLFAYPASALNFQNWLASGLSAILGARLGALFANLQSAIAVEGAILLAPLVIWAAMRQRAQIALHVAAFAWAALLVVMSFAFPFSGARGGFFHAAAALQPMVWALAAVGLGYFVEWGAAKRGWKKTQAAHIFSLGVLVLLAALSVFVFYSRVIASSVWNASAEHYVNLGKELTDLGISSDAIVMVNNPPGFSLASAHSAIVIPYGGLDVTLSVAQRYGAHVLLLEANHPAGLNDLYSNPEDLPGLSYIASLDGTHIFFFTN